MATNPIADMQERVNWHWRNTMRPVRFFGLDARSAIPYTFLIVYFRPITLILAIVTTIAFFIMEKQGLTFPAAMRKIRRGLLSDVRPGITSFRHRTFKDFG